MISFLVVFNHGEEGWYGTSQTAAKESEARTPEEAILFVKQLACIYYKKPRNFKAIWN